MRIYIRYQNFPYFIKLALLFFGFALVLASCSRSKPAPRSSLRISFNTWPSTFDPRRCADFVSSTIVCMTYEGLTRCLPEGNVELALAKEIEISSDKLTYTFHLRDAFWSDGQPITAYDFESSWKEILSPPKPCAFLFYPIKNAERCVKKEIAINEVGILALDEKTLQVKLENPTPYFQNLTAFPSFLCAPAHNPGAKVLSGPFLYESISENHEIVLKKNAFYWNRKNIFLDKVHISIVPDESTALEMFENGDLDWLGGPLSPLPPDAIDKLKDDLIFIPNAASTICTFNTQEFPFCNLNLRKAFALSINRDEIVERVTGAGQVPAKSMLPPTFSGQEYPLTDLKKAKEHFEMALKELGIDPRELESLVLFYRPSQIEKRLAQTLQSGWFKAFGIQISLAQLDYKSHTHRLQTRDYQLALASWIAQFDDPLSILSRFKDSSHLKNYPGWEDSFYSNLLDIANSSENRLEVLAEAEKVFGQNMPLCPIYHWSSPALCSSRVESIATTPCGGVLFERFKLKTQ